MIPTKWFITFLTYGDRKFEQLLLNVSNADHLKQREFHFNEICKQRDLLDFKDGLYQLSRCRLVERVQNYEIEVQQLRQEVAGYKWKLRYLDKLRNRNKKAILGEKFDEAFNKY